MSFDIGLTNHLLKILDPSVSIAGLGQGKADRMRLQLLLKKLTVMEAMLHAPESRLQPLQTLSQQLEQQDGHTLIAPYYQRLRHYFETKPWLLITIPSGRDRCIDKILCDPELVGFYGKSQEHMTGAILQLDKPYQQDMAVMDIHPALHGLLARRLEWPGLFILIPGAEVVFLPLHSQGYMEIDIEARLQWVFNKLYADQGLNLAVLSVQYQQAFSEAYEQQEKTLHILQLSDLAIGSRATAFRLSQLKHCIRILIDELGENSRIVPVISGNLLASPGEEHVDEVRQFWRFLETLGIETPLFVFGRRDVRNDGNINEGYRTAISFQTAKVCWFEQQKLAIISLNSVMHGNLPDGAIGQEQIETIEHEISRQENSEDYRFIILMHHAPVWFDTQSISPESRDFYQTVYRVDTLPTANPIKNHELLQAFVEKNSIEACLQGSSPVSHSAILQNNIAIIVCGPSAGTPSKYDGRVYFNLNILSLNTANQKKILRLVAFAADSLTPRHLIRHERIVNFSDTDEMVDFGRL
ncbi:metallophosphoesterase family protein [methane-oxidizing endosymbiont of Gigantopelta aegis]|uniref:metallophosphoesterase family protein n=1 Tax=methane-oxidizing endosymbiont of Gigantopelta aegis TaxID=2794938 RepID=UPI0018DBEB14|nr:metallophosphoesterase [methane-oxidizing endosymbiont of Gigantopelta aegis]